MPAPPERKGIGCNLSKAGRDEWAEEKIGIANDVEETTRGR
jgi:hypothetical protein